MNGTFVYTDPRHCTVHDPKHSTCYLDGVNKDGFYEGGPIVVSPLGSGFSTFVTDLSTVLSGNYPGSSFRKWFRKWFLTRSSMSRTTPRSSSSFRVDLNRSLDDLILSSIMCAKRSNNRHLLLLTIHIGLLRLNERTVSANSLYVPLRESTCIKRATFTSNVEGIIQHYCGGTPRKRW